MHDMLKDYLEVHRITCFLQLRNEQQGHAWGQTSIIPGIGKGILKMEKLSWCLHRNFNVSWNRKGTPQATKENHKHQCHHKTLDLLFVLSEKYDIVSKIGYWWHKTCGSNQPVSDLS